MTAFRTPACVVALAAGLALAPAARAVITYQLVAITGTDNSFGPGAGPGVSFFALGGQQPSINDSGQVAFRGQDSTAGNPNGVWLRSAGANSVQAIANGAQPGGGTYASSSLFNNTMVNNAGQMAWRLGAGTGIFSNVGAGPARSMLTGDGAPGTVNSGPLATYSSVASGMPLFNQAGAVAYVGNLNTSAATDPPVVFTAGIANSSGIWTGTPGSMTLGLRQNDTLGFLDGTGNTRMGAFSTASMALNGAGKYVVQTALQGSNVVTGTGATGNSTGIFSNRTGSLAAIGRAGNAAPDAAGAASATDLYRTFATSAIAFNDTGRVAFTATLRNAAGTQTSTGAFFTDTHSGTMRQLARFGDTLPTIYDAANNPISEFAGATWGISYNNPAINSADTLVFNATGLGGTATSSNNSVILSLDSAGRLHKIVRSGDVAVLNGAPLGGDARFLSPSNIQINAAGQIAFASSLTGAGVSVGLGNGSALFAWDLDGSLAMVARTGDLFEALPGDFRTIASIGGLATTGGQDGRTISLNSSGDLVFELDFSNGTSGIFTAHIPTPGSAALLALGGLAAARRRRR